MNPEIYTPKKYPWYKELWWKIQYYCWYVPSTLYYNVKWFFGNLWRFRKILWNCRTWDFYYNAMLMSESLEWLADTIENGHEVEASSSKKAESIRELSFYFKYLVDDTEFGTWDDPRIWDNNRPLIPLEKISQIMEKRRDHALKRICELLKGQSLDSKPYSEEWYKEFDGSGYEGWWD